jgi:uncharacterized protein YndB with AHSA1/START domain
MTRQKDLKRRVRARMQKTGESYTTARAVLVKSPKSAAPPLPANYLELTPVGDDAVQGKTGKTWPAWVATLDAIGAAALPHRDIATRVYEMGVPGWWAQNVTVGYERIRGLRAQSQSRGGKYTAHKSKTFTVPVERLCDAFASARLRKRWLDVPGLRVSKVTAPKWVRMRWDDGAHVEVGFLAKGAAKSQAAIQHGDLPDQGAVAERKAFWNDRLNALAALLGAEGTRARR